MIGVSIFFQNVWLGIVVGAAMVINMLVAGTVGTIVPLALRAMRVDPAVASSVIVTTFTDSVGYAAFYTIATVLINRLPHEAIL
jgi:magnesium transporter